MTYLLMNNFYHTYSYTLGTFINYSRSKGDISASDV